MRHRNRGRKLGRNSQERKALMRSLARALVLSKDGRIATTLAKAKEVTPFVHKLVTLGKHGSLHDFRRALALLPDRDVVRTIFKQVAPQYASRNGGYTRILHPGAETGRFRMWGVGDRSERAILEFVGYVQPTEPEPKPEEAKAEKKGLIQRIREKTAKGPKKGAKAGAAS